MSKHKDVAACTKLNKTCMTCPYKEEKILKYINPVPSTKFLNVLFQNTHMKRYTFCYFEC